METRLAESTGLPSTLLNECPTPSTPLPHNERQRVGELRAFDVLDTLPEEDYDTITRLVASICGTPIALVSLVDARRQWFKSRYGLGTCETSRDSSFCAHAILRPSDIFVVPDALLDPRFRDNPLVTGEPNIRFYAGMPLVTKDGIPLGSICAIDRVPRDLGPQQLEALRLASRTVMALLEERRAARALDRLRQETRVAENRFDLLQSVAINASEGIMIVETSEDLGDPSRIIYVNDSFARLTGLACDDVLGGTTERIWGDTDRARVRDIRRRLHGTSAFTSVIDYARRDGETPTFEISFSPITGDAAVSRPNHWIVLLRDVTDRVLAERERRRADTVSIANEELQHEIARRRQVEDELRIAATNDPLTNLPNRAFFMKRLRESMAAGQLENDKASFGVLFIDIDRFKQINDTLGHLFGDDLLTQVAARLKASARSGDLVARFGGDEFTVIVRDSGNLGDVERVAARMIDELNEPCKVAGSPVFVSASVGVVMVDESYESTEDVLRDADIAMFHAKDRGRNRYEFFRPELRERVRVKTELDGALRTAFERREFYLAYQPIMSFGSQPPQLEGFEALLRWDRPAHSTVTTSDMIERAEESGLIVPLGEWVVETACRQLVAWNDIGATPLLSVNVSPKQLTTPHFTGTVERILSSTGADATRLAFELTESAMMQDPDGAMRTLGALRAFGAKIYLDDFGTGYSSLSYLRRFAVDRLKIDRSFVSGTGDDIVDPDIIDTIITLAHRLGIETVVEGIETSQQLRRLLDMGCDAGQGFLFSRGVPAAAATKLLTGDRTLLSRI